MPRHHVTRSYPRARLQCTPCKTRWLSPPLHCWLNPPSMDPSQGSPRLRHPWHCWLRPSRHCWLRPPWQSCLCPRDRCQWDRRCRCLPNYSQFCDHIGAMLGPFWGHLGVSLRSFWDHLGAILGPSWDQPQYRNPLASNKQDTDAGTNESTQSARNAHPCEPRTRHMVPWFKSKGLKKNEGPPPDRPSA